MYFSCPKNKSVFSAKRKEYKNFAVLFKEPSNNWGMNGYKEATGVNEAPHLQYGNHHQVLPLSYQLFLGFSFSLSVSPWTKWQVVELSPHALRGRPPGCWEGVEDSNLLPGAVDGRFSMGLDASSTSDLGESLKTPEKQTINK